MSNRCDSIRGLVLGHQTDHLEMSEALPRNHPLPVETMAISDEFYREQGLPDCTRTTIQDQKDGLPVVLLLLLFLFTSVNRRPEGRVTSRVIVLFTFVTADQKDGLPEAVVFVLLNK
ncbi:Hypothetical predicted protein [Mytilus galloprovincialis]|uniref:Uncharacterized protein n=1 Tax=Mytilus galloprovincialis TaxID=29158 RepID=A0A8B6H4B8_MYTGA|nr:Hypothetical predicted protein [Mytilus galloprovincialis]